MSSALGAFVTYALASCFFWHYPHLLHKRKRIPFVAAHISHRGGSAEGYENTLRAFQNAINKGTDMLELDVRLTKDGEVVVFHDQDLKRMAGKEEKVCELEYQHLPNLRETVPIDTIPGTCFSDTTKWSQKDRRIPLLREVLAEFPKVPMNIDIKDDSDELIVKVAELLKRYDRREITVWGSFNNRVCQKCYEVSPETCLFFSAKRVVILILYAVTGLLPFVPLKETHYEVFLPLALQRRRLQQVTQLSPTEKVLVWICNKFLVWKPLISHLHRRGIHVYYWVCNNEDEFALCKAVGATGVMTDHPTKLRQFLDSNFEHSDQKPSA